MCVCVCVRARAHHHSHKGVSLSATPELAALTSFGITIKGGRNDDPNDGNDDDDEFVNVDV